MQHSSINSVIVFSDKSSAVTRYCVMPRTKNDTFERGRIWSFRLV